MIVLQQPFSLYPHIAYLTVGYAIIRVSASGKKCVLYHKWFATCQMPEKALLKMWRIHFYSYICDMIHSLLLKEKDYETLIYIHIISIYFYSIACSVYAND